MKKSNSIMAVLLAVLAIAGIQTRAMAQEETQEEKPSKYAKIRGEGTNVKWDVKVPYSSATLTVSTPDGDVIRKEFKSDATPQFSSTHKNERLPDGAYTYELRLSPVISDEVKKSLKESREKGNDAETVRALRKRGQLPTEPLVESGSFLIQNGSITAPGAMEPRGQRRVGDNQLNYTKRQEYPGPFPVQQSTRIQRHHLSPMVMPDQVIPDDLIVQGSLCVGLDCVNGEVFNFDTIKLKENNTRIKFEDTSTSAGFPSTDWQLTANDSASGGANKFSIDDVTAGTTPFTVTGGATTNSVFVASNGKVGFRTSTPVLDLHVNTSDTPAIRLEQNSSGGFSAQTWDIGANEANFFVRDVTGGSRLSLRIRPGAPTSSIDISAAGNVGMGTTNPVISNNPSARFLAVDAGTGNFSEIGAGGNQTGTTSILGALGFFNSNLAVAEKRNAVIVGANDGATNSGNLQFFTANAGTITERMRIRSNGQVGIGTTAPTDTLSVNGTASKTGGGSWSVFSDERLKTIKGEFTSGLKAVMQLQPLRYVYRSDNAMDLKSQGEHVGFGAQTLQKVIPEAVTRNDQGYLMVNNDPVIWTMLNAIKEQQREIEELRKEVKQLRAVSRRHRK
jgi:hypothetical protein